MSKYAPGTVYIQIMLQEQIELKILPQIIHAPGAAAPGTAVPGAAAPGAYFRAKISQKRPDRYNMRMVYKYIRLI